jgi:CDP-diacylglycerol pyrophosphatase/Domain of unknown function (DUF309)
VTPIAETRTIGVIYFLMVIGLMFRPRWLPQKSFPPYAYLPGKKPHPVRDPTGHSYHVEPIPVTAEASLDSDAFLWGLDLFNHGYYWEAHQAWEGLLQVADRDGPLRMLFKGLILLSAAGIKIREGKHAAAVRHTGRAAALLRRLMKVPDHAFERALGMSPAALAEYAEVASRLPATLQATAPGQPQPVFNFILGSNSCGFPKGADGQAPERDAIALVVNSAAVRGHDQLHIHVGCLLPSSRFALAAAAAKVPMGEWARIGAVVPHTMFWGLRIRGTDLSNVEPFRLAAEAFAGKAKGSGDLTIAVAGVRVESDDEFLILASYATAPGGWWPVGSDDLLYPACPAGRGLAG